jgi:hypothetical protein
MTKLFTIFTAIAALAACGNLSFGYVTFIILFIPLGMIVAQIRN